MKLTVALLAVLLTPVSGSFLPKDVKAEPKAVVASTAKQSPHVVPVPSKPTVKLPIPHGHPEAGGALRPAVASSKPAVKSESKPAVAAKVAPKPVVAASKPAAKVEAKPVVAKPTDKVSPHIVPVPAKPTVKLPIPHGHPEADGAVRPAAAKVEAKPVAVSPKPVAKVVTKPVAIAATAPVPQAAVAVAVTHAKVEAKPAMEPTIHDHAVSAQKSAGEALHHLEEAQKAYEMTKANVKETLKVGKKIGGTADKVKTLYTPRKLKTPQSASPRTLRSFVEWAFLAILMCSAFVPCLCGLAPWNKH